VEEMQRHEEVAVSVKQPLEVAEVERLSAKRGVEMSSDHS
jgi:hypothetical protein